MGFYKSITLIKFISFFFQALGRDFRLILSPKKGLLHPKFRAVELDDNNIEKPIRIDHETFYDGRVYGETKSRATVHLEPEVESVQNLIFRLCPN